MKVAIVHYWLVNMRGGEKVVEALCEMFPEADIYTHAYSPENISPVIGRHDVRTSFIGRLPFAGKLYKHYLPLMPLALEQLDLRGYDLVISSESGPAKGVLTSPHTRHLCYCHTPMRYLWDFYQEYLEDAGGLVRFFMRPLTHYLRMWDVMAANRVDAFVANSENVAQRISKHYRRDAEVVHPPVELDRFALSEETDDYYLMVGQLVKYKRPDLAVKAFNRLGKRLVIVGGGEMLEKLRKMAAPNVEVLGRRPEGEITRLYARCRALIFPGEEDFGIVPLEAMASGRPVIAYGKGGALETVVDGRTGLFFHEQTVEDLAEAVGRFEQMEDGFEPGRVREHAAGFGKDSFKKKIHACVNRLMAGDR